MDVEEIPDPAFHLSQNRPNPFHPRTLIRFSLVTADQATLTIYDTSGRLLRTLLDGPVGQGPTSVEWDGTDDAGRAVASGVYLYRLKTRTASLTRRLVLAR